MGVGGQGCLSNERQKVVARGCWVLNLLLGKE